MVLIATALLLVGALLVGNVDEPSRYDGDRIIADDGGQIVQTREDRWSVRDDVGRETGTIVRMPSGRLAVRDERGRTEGYLRCLRCDDRN